jgi:hypothetical protein
MTLEFVWRFVVMDWILVVTNEMMEIYLMEMDALVHVYLSLGTNVTSQLDMRLLARLLTFQQLQD